MNQCPLCGDEEYDTSMKIGFRGFKRILVVGLGVLESASYIGALLYLIVHKTDRLGHLLLFR